MQENPGLRSATGGLRVRFIEDASGGLSTLELEIPRQQGVVSDIHQALYAIGVHISSVELHVRADAMVERLKLSERDGARLTRERYLAVQNEVMDIVQRRLIDSVRPQPLSRSVAS